MVGGPRVGSLRRRIRREGPLTLLFRWIARLAYAFVGLSLAAVILFRFVDPPFTLLMLQERWRLEETVQEWRPIERIAPTLRRAVIAAEDARFCAHRGFDVDALRKAAAEWRAGGRLIGASTISQQTAKNVFLWPARSFVRKGFEFWFTALIEIFWPKDRILEVYLNVAEFGPGVFGAEAAARASFGYSAEDLGPNQAARLAAVLPAPRRLDPLNLPAEREARVAAIADGALLLRNNGGAACVED